MKILQLLAGGKHGGAETAFVDTCIAMHEHGFDQRILTRPNETRIPRLRKAGLDVVTLPFGGALDIYTPMAIARHVRDFQPDIIQSWMSRAAAKVRHTAKSAHRNHKSVHIARLGNYYNMKYFQSVDGFIAITPMIRDYIIQSGIPARDVTHINNFAETESPSGTNLREKMAIADDTPLLLALGRLHNDKAHDVLLMALTDIPKAHLWIAGDGPDKDKLKALARTLGVSDRVDFLGWRSDRADLFQAADICVFASRDEPFGTVFVQSWMHETPVVVSDADGPRQFVCDGEDGLIVPKEDPPKLAQAILSLIHDADLRARIVANGRKRYTDEFTKEKTITDYKRFYEDMIFHHGLGA